MVKEDKIKKFSLDLCSDLFERKKCPADFLRQPSLIATRDQLDIEAILRTVVALNEHDPHL